MYLEELEKKISNLKLSNFTIFPTALSNYTHVQFGRHFHSPCTFLIAWELSRVIIIIITMTMIQVITRIIITVPSVWIYIFGIFKMIYNLILHLVSIFFWTQFSFWTKGTRFYNFHLLNKIGLTIEREKFLTLRRDVSSTTSVAWSIALISIIFEF